MGFWPEMALGTSEDPVPLPACLSACLLFKQATQRVAKQPDSGIREYHAVPSLKSLYRKCGKFSTVHLTDYKCGAAPNIPRYISYSLAQFSPLMKKCDPRALFKLQRSKLYLIGMCNFGTFCLFIPSI